MIKPTTQILEEAKHDLQEIIDYVAQETDDVTLLLWLQDFELKFGTIYRRLSSPVTQQSDLKELKSYVEAGELPPLGSAKSRTQYINSDK